MRSNILVDAALGWIGSPLMMLARLNHSGPLTYHPPPFVGGPLWQMCHACPTFKCGGGIVRRA
jgi:hypothetical protein